MTLVLPRPSCAAFIGCLLHFAWAAGAAGPATAPAGGPGADAKDATHGSLWGPAVGGVQIRVRGPVRVEEHALVPVSVQFLCDPDHLPPPKPDPGRRPPAADRLNTFLFPALVSLTLVNVSTGEQFTVEPYDPTSGMPVQDVGDQFVTLGTSPGEPLAAKFPLLPAGDQLKAGTYDCTLTWDAGRARPEWKAGRPGWKAGGPPAAEGFWDGRVSSAPLRLEVVPEVARAREFLVPTRLHVAEGQVRFDNGDSEKVSLPIRNGYFTGMTIRRQNGSVMISSGGFDARNMTVEQLSDDPAGPKGAEPGDRKLSYTIEIFETPDPPAHMWMPTEGQKGYKTLWKRAFEVGADVPPARKGGE